MRWAASLLIFAATPVEAEVQITIAPTGHATVPVEGEFGVRQFVFDTGAEGSAVYAGFADEAKLRAAGTEILQGQTGAAATPLVKAAFLAVDGTRKENLEMLRLDPRSDGVPLAGIVGLDIFGDRTLDFDLPNKRLALLSTGQRPSGLSGVGIPAAPTTGNLLTVPVTIDGVRAVAVIDTGARKTRINWKLGRALGIDPEAIAKGDVIQGATNTAIETGATEVANVQLGERALASAPVLVADLPVFDTFGVADRPAVILGLDWLTHTRLIVDFPARRVWFERRD
jgi:hypothetical protein